MDGCNCIIQGDIKPCRECLMTQIVNVNNKSTNVENWRNFHSGSTGGLSSNKKTVLTGTIETS